MSNCTISRQLGCSEKTVRDAECRVKETGQLADRPRSGRPVKLSNRDEKMIVCHRLKDRKKTAWILASEPNQSFSN